MGKKRIGAWSNFYKNRQTRHATQKNKIKRTLQSQGFGAARDLAQKFGLLGFLATISKGDENER